MNVTRHLLAFLFFTIPCAAPIAAQTPAPAVRLEYHWLSEGVSGPSHVYPDPAGGDVALSDSVVLALDGVARADAVRGGPNRDGWDVIVRLTPSAAATFADATATHVGHRLAVVLDGRVVQIVSIGGRLGRVAGVLSDVPKPVADSVAARLTTARSPIGGRP